MPLQKFKGVDRASTQLHITHVEDDDQCNRSVVDGNEHTPRGVEENNDHACVRLKGPPHLTLAGPVLS